MSVRAIACCLLAVLFGAPLHAQSERELVVASKKFTESVVLGEIVAQLLESSGYGSLHRRELGGSRILFNGMQAGDVDVYPEYTGTLMRELLADRNVRTVEEAREVLAREHSLGMTEPLGFNNTYAIGVLRSTAEELGLERVSDLAEHPGLRLAFSNEFMDRADGWPGLRDAYGLENPANGMDHDLAYRALQSGDIDGMDLYSTDAEIEYYDLVVLEDDRAYFPRYDAVLLYRLDLDEGAVASIERLSGAIDESTMSRLNRLAKIGDPDAPDRGRVHEAVVAQRFLGERLGVESVATIAGTREMLVRITLEHLALVGYSMALAIAVAVPLGIVAVRIPTLAPPILWGSGLLQTMPSLALLVLLIPLFGLSPRTAIAALFLYSLLPIVRNTYAGIRNIPGDIVESAEAIGLTSAQRLRDVELPMALPMILAGVKTAVVINVGTATLAALIGAGGYGQPILTGIRLDDFSLILTGAVPAGAMAIGAQLLFDGAERLLVSRGLRL